MGAVGRQQPVQSRSLDLGIVGGGLLGLTLGYRFAAQGHRVTIYERDATVGGLIRSIEVNGITMDRFYHVILKSDRNWIGLINELGLGDRIYFKETKAGFYHKGKVYPMATFSEYLRFPLLSLSDKLRLAFSLQYCNMRRDWRGLENVSIRDFLVSIGGENLFERFWKPLLRSKFDNSYDTIPMTYIWSRVKRMASTRTKITKREIMGHIKGNLQIVVNTLEREILRLGGSVLTRTPIKGILCSDNTARGVKLDNGDRKHDVIISTLPHPQYQKLLPEQLRSRSPATVEYMGIVCILILLRNRLTPFHTLNLIDDTVPYTGIIETTNVIDPDLMGGRHLVYIPKYVSPKNKQSLARSDGELKEECFRHLRGMFPAFHEENVEGVWIGREAFVEPMYTLNFYKTIPSFRGPVGRLFVANNSQTYPFLLNCESVVSLAGRVVEEIYSSVTGNVNG